MFMSQLTLSCKEKNNFRKKLKHLIFSIFFLSKLCSESQINDFLGSSLLIFHNTKPNNVSNFKFCF